ncbi:hypothetical protein ACWGJB_09260 [Streptomyces sp. NPDC054813]
MVCRRRRAVLSTRTQPCSAETASAYSFSSRSRDALVVTLLVQLGLVVLTGLLSLRLPRTVR